MNNLSKFLVEGILNEGIVVLLPGGFKPPHIGHFQLAKKYASEPRVSEVQVLIGPKQRNGITRDQSLAVWKLLIKSDTSGVARKIKVMSVAEDNPLLAAYKYIETAQPGTYALAASSKGDDYQRVQKFVDGHTKGAKYARPGVSVIELPLDTNPIMYKGRTDANNNKGISASVLRADLAANDYNNFKTNYPGMSDTTLKSIYSTLTNNKKPNSLQERSTLKELIHTIKEYETRELLLCGGAAGHMTHPYEDYDLSFDDVLGMIDSALGGKVEYAQEKLDGQNLMVTYKDGEVRAARNKGHVKNAGATSLTLKQIENTFAGRGSIQTAFTEAMRDLKTAIDNLTPAQKSKFFGNGTKFLNLEVLFPETANVVPYGATQLRLHNITEYDPNGNVMSTDQDSARRLEGALRQIEAANQKTFEIRVTDPVTINKSKDYKQQKAELEKTLTDLKNEYKLKGNSKLQDYVETWWKNYITTAAKGYKYSIPQEVLQQLVNRWGLNDKGVNIKIIRDGINNEEFKNWVAEFDKGEYNIQKKVCIKPIENLFLKLGVYTLQNVSQLVSINPDQSVRQIKKDLRSSIERIKQAVASPENADNDAPLRFLKRELTRLKDIGGFDAILPLEGIVFKYNGKLYKLTGAFAPINQLLGYLRF
jgi:hypothetical protein